MLRALNLKNVYKSETDNLMVDFYIPVLRASVSLDRAVGYFSGVTLSYAAQGLAALFASGGKARLIVGAFTDEEDLAAVCHGYRLRDVQDGIAEDMLNQIEQIREELFQFRLEVLAKLIQFRMLDIKVAVRKRGMYHEKIGIATDLAGDSVTFMGSANESVYALLPGYNYESISVFPSWRVELADYVTPHRQSFDRLWLNQEKNTIVITAPDAVLARLEVLASKTAERTVEMELGLWEKLRAAQASNVAETVRQASPKLPTEIGGQPFTIRAHQQEALRLWQKEQGKGILALATGAGKTVTALYGMVKLSQISPCLVVVIAVPYQNLADQWCEEANGFGIRAIRCYESKADWHEELSRAIHEINFGLRELTVIVVVNRTLKSSTFQSCLKRLPMAQTLWIGDECHHHGAEGIENFLPFSARFRMGLSATPVHYLDNARNTRLEQFYGPVVYEYSLSQAIIDNVLTPYDYHVMLIELTFEETEQFLDLSQQIGKLYAKDLQAGLSQNESEILKSLLRSRTRLVGGAENKLKVLHSHLQATPRSKHVLFYCSEGVVNATAGKNVNDDSADEQSNVAAVCQLLTNSGWNVSKFTAAETRRDREVLLEHFKLGKIDALVAMRCLDEGIDIPSCSIAYILASTKDPRQFIQRRGRILRRAPGKKFATIYDFVVVPPNSAALEGNLHARKLIEGELRRVAEFAALAQNSTKAYEVLRRTLINYGLEYCV